MPPQEPSPPHRDPRSVTSATLLDGLRNNDAQAWQRWTEIYTPLIAHWCQTAGLPTDDVADVTQEALRSVFLALPDFRRGTQQGSFRSWLKTIVRNKVIDHFRARQNKARATGGTDALQQLARLPDLAVDETPDEQRVGSRLILQGTLHTLQAEFADSTWQAFWQTTVDDRAAGDVAADLGLTLNAVYTAKSRVLRRIRELLRDLEDDVVTNGVTA